MKDNLSRMLALFVASCIFVRMSVLCVFAWTGILYYVMIMCFAFYSLYIYFKGIAVYSIDKPLLCFLAVGFISTSNPQLSPSMSFLRVHVLSLLNYHIN